jgi:hypothetical protein
MHIKVEGSNIDGYGDANIVRIYPGLCVLLPGIANLFVARDEEERGKE